MTNVVQAGKVTKEIQVGSKSPSKSPKGEFETIFNLETETLKTDSAEEGNKAKNGIGEDGETEVEEPLQETIHEEPDENDDAMMQLSYLIQGNPPLQLKSSVPNLKSSADTKSAEIQLTPAGSLKLNETPANPWIKEPQGEIQSVKADEAVVFKAETPALVEVLNDIPQALQETEIRTVPEGKTETNPIEVVPEKQSKSEVLKGNQNRNELKQQKIEGNPLESKAVPKIEEALLKSNLSSSGEEMKNEASDKTQKEAQSEQIENFPAAIKASEVQKAQIPSSPEVTKAQNENLDLAVKEILHQMETLTDGHKSMVKVKLNPKELGEMEISLSMQEGRLTGKIVVGNKEIQQIFTDKLHELNQTLKENRIDVASFEVKLSPDQHQNQEQARHQGRRPMDYPSKFNNQRNGSTQTEEWIRPANPSNRGIDILA